MGGTKNLAGGMISRASCCLKYGEIDTMGNETMKNAYAVNASNFSSNTFILHDMICIGFTFDYAHKSLTLTLDSELREGNYTKVIFDNVLAHQMVSCDFWGSSLHIYAWSLVDEAHRLLYQQMEDEIKTNKYDLSRFDPKEQYMEIEIQFTSGDVLRILCQNILMEACDAPECREEH